jgi:hypothetical protein
MFRVLGLWLWQYLRPARPGATGLLVMLAGVLALRFGVPAEWPLPWQFGSAFGVLWHGAQLGAFLRFRARPRSLQATMDGMGRAGGRS